MKRLFALTALAVLFISSCKKDEIEPTPQPAIPNYMPLAIGNYWVYQDYQVDSLGNDNPQPGIDSIYINRDTIINDNTYYIIEGTYSPFHHNPGIVSILRDSSGYLVTHYGNILYSATNFTDTLADHWSVYNGDTVFYSSKKMDITEYAINVPAGNFITYDCPTTFKLFTPTEDTLTDVWHLYNAEGVGTIIETWRYSPLNGILNPYHFEKHLIRYHIVEE